MSQSTDESWEHNKFTRPFAVPAQRDVRPACAGEWNPSTSEEANRNQDNSKIKTGTEKTQNQNGILSAIERISW